MSVFSGAPKGSEGMRCSRALLICLLALELCRSAHALPVFAQRYKVECVACHALVPRLNAVGIAFKANFYRGLQKPLGQGTVPLAYQQSEQWKTTQSLNGTRQSALGELFLVEGFSFLPGKPRAFFAQVYTQTNGEIPRKALGELYLSLPLLGNHGELALTVGQARALPQQYEPRSRRSHAQGNTGGNRTRYPHRAGDSVSEVHKMNSL